MILQLIGVVLLTVLAVILFRSKLHLEFHLFFLYVLFSMLATIGLIALAANYQLYFKAFWATEAFDALLALLALFEAFHHVFILDFRAWPWFKVVFPATVAILCIIFIGDALLHPAAQAPTIIRLILAFGTVVNCVKGGLFLMFLILGWLLLGESWPTYPYGVVLGFAVSTAGSLAAFWLRSIFGTKFNSIGKYGPPVAYILAVLIWIASCYLPPEPKGRWTNVNDPEKSLATVRQYVRALRRIAGKDR
jgi:hypothetical protein